MERNYATETAPLAPQPNVIELAAAEGSATQELVAPAAPSVEANGAAKEQQEIAHEPAIDVAVLKAHSPPRHAVRTLAVHIDFEGLNKRALASAPV